MPLPIYESRLHIAHGIDNQFGKPTVADPVTFPDIVVNKEISYLPFAVTARRAQVFRIVRAQALVKCGKHLLQFLSPRHLSAPVAEVVRAHDGEAAPASTAV